jgi:hypothetical protein
MIAIIASALLVAYLVAHIAFPTHRRVLPWIVAIAFIAAAIAVIRS